MQLTDYAENVVINHFMSGATYTPPASIWLALYTTPTGDDGSGTQVTGGSYSPNIVRFDPAVDGYTSNYSATTFVNMPDAVVTHVALLDAVAGNMLWHGPLAASKTVVAGSDFQVSIGDITVGFTPESSATTYFQNLILDTLLRRAEPGWAAYPPTPKYLGLYTSATDAAGGGTEVSGNGYARQLLELTVATTGTATTLDILDVDLMPAATVTHAAVHDAVTAGNMLLQAPLAASVTTTLNDIVRFGAGDITHTVR